MGRVFVTGGSGFIGTNLVQYLLNQGAPVLNFDINPPRDRAQSGSWVKGDILDLELLLTSVRRFRPDYYVHLAARTDLDGHDITQYETNTKGVLNVIKSVKECAGLKRVLFASSRLVCKIGYTPLSEDDYCPDTMYGKSKVIGEQLVRDHANNIPAPWMIFRPTSIWGPWFDTPYKEFFMSIYNSHYIHPRGRAIKKSFGFVGNLVYMLDKILHCDNSVINGKTIYLSDYPPLDLREWAGMIAAATGKQHPREVPVLFLKGLAVAGDILKKAGWNKPPLTRFRLNNLLTDMVYDTAQIEAICGELPYSLQDGVMDTVAWLKSHAG